MNSNVNQTAIVFLLIGNVMAISTVQMAQTNITDALPGPVLLRFSAVIMATVFIMHGSVMVTMTAGIWAMREIVRLSPSGAPAGSGNVQVTVSVWIWAKYVIILPIVLMELTNPHCAVSYCSSIYHSLLCDTPSERKGIFSVQYLVHQHS